MHFYLRDWAAWDGEAKGKVLAQASPASLRRRVSPIGQYTLQSAWNLAQSGQIRLIFSSRHGEYSRTISLFESLARDNSVSPTDFTLSVHHGLIGLLSIAQKNRSGHTAISSGAESFCYGLLEALACLKEKPDDPVMLIHCDDPLPEPFSHFNEEGESSIAMALLLAMHGSGEELEFSLAPSSTFSHPSRYASDFLHFINSRAPDLLSIGKVLQCQWKRHASANNSGAEYYAATTPMGNH